MRITPSTARHPRAPEENCAVFITSRLLASLGLFLSIAFCTAADPPNNPPRPNVTSGGKQISGIYPHLASFNNESECGTGAVVPWANRLWVVTYAPHGPKGSTDKLYEIDDNLTMTIRPESIGGTPANRMIHNESRQLFIGPYVINDKGGVRAIPYDRMYGRPTGTARHLFDSANKVYFATMEEGLYEVDVDSLAVTELWRDEQLPDGKKSNLPGYHGKGFFSGQGRVVYSNNGEHGPAARENPEVPSGVLATWDGKSPEWTNVRRNQFTEVTGPGGIAGNANPETDPIWSIGWDHRSLILQCLADGEWTSYRLPKSSHSYDGAHGWNTEWPRIRDIGEDDLLMTMHGQFWRFPKTFRPGQTAGIVPRSSYLKVIADFCRWQDRLVFGCDDAARAEFLNTRKVKGKIPGPAFSQSNLWFVAPERLDQFGPARGRGAIWVNEQIPAKSPSEPFLFSGFAQRGVHLAFEIDSPLTVRFEVDRDGTGQWSDLKEVTVPKEGYVWHSFDITEQGAWIRAHLDQPANGTIWFEYRTPSQRAKESDGSPAQFTKGLLPATAESGIGGLVRAGDPATGLQLLAKNHSANGINTAGYYELKSDLTLQKVDDPAKQDFMAKQVATPLDVLTIDGNSVLYLSEKGERFRLPIGNPAYRAQPQLLNQQRTSREVTTERDLFQAAGTFFELPARNAGDFAKIMPITTHPFKIQDYCSWRGMLVLTGIEPMKSDSEHIIRSEDGKAAVWLGVVDDLWSFGKPVGSGGPWHDTAIEANVPSDPYLMAGYDEKKLTLSHQSAQPVSFEIQVDITGTGEWHTCHVIEVPPGEATAWEFPSGFQAYWVRFQTNQPTTATTLLEYR